MRVLVTGGAGYIGSHVVLELCENGYEVIVLDDLSYGNKEAVDSRAKFIKGSTLNNSDIELGLKNVDAVIHLAAFKAAGESMLDPAKYSNNNLIGSINLPIIKYSVEWWTTLHQPASIKIVGSSSIHSTMLLPLLVMLLVFLLYAALIFLMKYKTEIIRIKKKNIKRI